MTANRPKIVVLGSINMDLVAVARGAAKARRDGHGGREFATLPGGKGANQAVAAARLGADVRMIGRVGDDVFGPMLLENLQAKRGGRFGRNDHPRHVVRHCRHPARR